MLNQVREQSGRERDREAHAEGCAEDGGRALVVQGTVESCPDALDSAGQHRTSSANQRPPFSHTSSTPMPVVAASATTSSTVTTDQPNGGLRRPARSNRTVTTLLVVAGLSTSTNAEPPRRSSVAIRRSRAVGSPPMPTLPSKSR